MCWIRENSLAEKSEVTQTFAQGLVPRPGLLLSSTGRSESKILGFYASLFLQYSVKVVLPPGRFSAVVVSQ